MIRILHTADWQIGKPFGGFDPDRRGELRAERFAVVARIAALATEHGCDAVLVAGDAFDSNDVLDRDLQRTLDAMSGFKGPWVMLPGNHDAALSASVWTRLKNRNLPANVLIADRPEPIELLDGRLSVLPAPLTRRHEGADLTQWFDRAETARDVVRVGLAHGSVANRLPDKAESGNPIADDRAATARLDYLALGDWHGFVEIAERTVYAGTPEPDRYPQNRPGHVALVSIAGPGEVPGVEQVPVGRFTWTSMTVRLDGDIAALDEALGGVARPGETLINFILDGSLPLRERVRLDAALSRWRARLFDLRVDDSRLIDEPDEDDLDRIDTGGFVRQAVETLRALADDPQNPQREAARLALRMAYVEHARLSPGDGAPTASSARRKG